MSTKTNPSDLNSATIDTTAAPIFIPTATLRALLPYPSLLDHLHAALPTAPIHSPHRHHHETSLTSSLLLMPSWSHHPSLPYFGVKLVTTYSNNNNSPLNLTSVDSKPVTTHSSNDISSVDLPSIDFKLVTTHLSNDDSSNLPSIDSKLVTTLPSNNISSTNLPSGDSVLETTHPSNNNSSVNLPSVNSFYVLFDLVTGRTLAAFDAAELTLRRTACVSALASKYLAREDAEVMVMVGAGSLAPHLVNAHCMVRKGLRRVVVWNRTAERARVLVESLANEDELKGLSFEVTENLEEAVKMADIVSCATVSEQPLVLGKLLKPGAHVDLVGSFKPTMRECDDEVIKQGRVFVDNEAAFEEAGELVGAFKREVITKDEIEGTLAELIKGDKAGRRGKEEITVFKSVGSAVVDLLSAQLVYETHMKTRVK